MAAFRLLGDTEPHCWRAGAGAPGDRHERRSPLRPRLREGWRKRIAEIPSHVAPNTSNAEIAAIYVWSSRVNTLLAADANLNLLDDDDRGALLALRDEPGRDCAIAARILLRLALSGATERRVAPQSWRFARSNLGRPFIKDNREGLHFSVSHIDAVVMVAVGQGVCVGIDVELLDQEFEATVIKHFSHE